MSLTTSTNRLPILIALERERRRRARAKQGGAAPTSPLEWATANATIVHPVRGRIPFAPYAYQAAFLNSYAEPRRIVLKSRQVGFSQAVALEALYVAIHEAEATILLIS